MIFGTYAFALSFIILLVLYFALPKWPQRRALILVFSYLFYAAARPSYVLVLAGCTVASWLLARWIGSLPTGSKTRRTAFVLSLCVTVGTLATLKYSGFFLRNVQALAGLLGLRLAIEPAWRFVPLGISFFTFEAVSYLVDVQRETVRPVRRLTDLALYLSFFPNLTAGPIMRAGELVPQFRTPRTVGWSKVNLGFLLIVWGLVKKSVIADNARTVAGTVFNTAASAGFVDAWVGALAYSVQIYCDFSGYSDMAIGLAMLLGFELTTNFRAPYGVVGFRAFWQRWHISLSRWLRDYLFTPIALRRPVFGWMLFAVFLTMVLCGLWHGAGWTFLVWGALHGAYLVAERLWLKATKRRFRKRLAKRASLAGVGLTFLFATIAWVFFRASSLGDALRVLGGMFGRADEATALVGLIPRICVPLLALGLVAAHVLEQREPFVMRVARGPVWRHVLVLLALMAMLGVASVPAADFIYFGF